MYVHLCTFFRSGTSQSYANHSIALATSLRETDDRLFHHGVSQDGLPLSHDIQTGSHDLSGLSHDLHHTHSESDISSYSDNFPTMFSTHDPTEHAHTSSVTNEYLPPTSQAKITSSYSADVTTGYATKHTHHTHSHQDPPPPHTSSQVTLLTPHTQATNRLEQLEILYDARGRQINQLTSQLTANADDSERHIRILRHEKVQCYM